MKKKNSVNVCASKSKIVPMNYEREKACREFLRLYSVVENSYLGFLKGYYENLHIKVNVCGLKTNLNQMPNVLYYYGITVSKEEVLRPLFYSQYKNKGSRSAKVLRDQILKGNKSAKNEVLERRDELNDLMSFFLHQIQKRMLMAA